MRNWYNTHRKLGLGEELEVGGEKEGHSQDNLSLQDRASAMKRKTQTRGASSSQAKKPKNATGNDSPKDLEEEGDEETLERQNTP